jgi:hypothetical protein
LIFVWSDGSDTLIAPGAATDLRVGMPIELMYMRPDHDGDVLGRVIASGRPGG